MNDQLVLQHEANQVCGVDFVKGSELHQLPYITGFTYPSRFHLLEPAFSYALLALREELLLNELQLKYWPQD